MMIPTVHLNGTGKKSLLEELEAAYTALRAASDALRHVTVHGRDYYVQGPEAYTVARREMDARLTTLETLIKDVLDMHNAIQKQGKEIA